MAYSYMLVYGDAALQLYGLIGMCRKDVIQNNYINNPNSYKVLDITIYKPIYIMPLKMVNLLL